MYALQGSIADVRNVFPYTIFHTNFLHNVFDQLLLRHVLTSVLGHLQGAHTFVLLVCKLIW